MTRARVHLIDPNRRAVYQLISGCVRRAWLCGEDSLTGRSFDHRRQWIEERILFLAERFAVAVHGYAVMSNHYHLVIEVDPLAPRQWRDEDIAKRWLDLYPPKRWLDWEDPTTLDRGPEINALIADTDRLTNCRQRLGSLSWFMKLINEPLARMANREDRCTGRFWEGRFKSNALLDDAAWLAAAIYVDLNPFRAGIAPVPETAEHTSIRRRINRMDPSFPNRLPPVISSVADPWVLPISLDGYRALVACTAHRELDHPALRDLIPRGIAAPEWFSMVDAMNRPDRRAFGRIESLLTYMQHLGQRWLRYIRVDQANEFARVQF